MLCAVNADKVIGWKLYSKRKDGVKTTNIIEFIDTKCKKYLVIMDNAIVRKSKYIKW